MKMGLILADKIKIKKLIKENLKLKTSKLINAIKHMLNIEIGPQTQKRLKKTSLEDLNQDAKSKVSFNLNIKI